MNLRLKNRNGEFVRYRLKHRDSFVCGELSDEIFSSAERQRIIDYILKLSLRYVADTVLAGRAICADTFTNDNVVWSDREGGAGLDSSTSLGSKIAERFPLHE